MSSLMLTIITNLTAAVLYLVGREWKITAGEGASIYVKTSLKGAEIVLLISWDDICCFVFIMLEFMSFHADITFSIFHLPTW